MRPGVTEPLRRARRELEQVTVMLLRPSPEVLYSCEQRLATAIAEIEASRPEWKHAAGDEHAMKEARLTRQAFRHTRRLLENVVRFHAGWARVRASLTGGYRADGSVQDLPCPVRVLVEG
jgi:hypothetical protein